MLVGNKLVPVAAVMSGLKIAPMKRFLGLLSIDSQDPDYMKSTSLNILIRLTEQMYAAEEDQVRFDMFTSGQFDAGMRIFIYLFICWGLVILIFLLYVQITVLT